MLHTVFFAAMILLWVLTPWLSVAVAGIASSASLQPHRVYCNLTEEWLKNKMNKTEEQDDSLL